MNQQKPPKIFVRDSALRCPRCGSEYTHQHDVQVFARAEDDERERHTHIWGTCNKNNFGIHTEEIDADGTIYNGNPSPRRDGVTIGLWCEECGDGNNRFELHVYQHKGQTFIETGARSSLNT